MDENRLSGTAKNRGGKVEEVFGRATGDAKTQVRGQMHQAEGSVQDLYGQAKDAAGACVGALCDQHEGGRHGKTGDKTTKAEQTAHENLPEAFRPKSGR